MLIAGAVRAEPEPDAGARAQALFDEARNLMKDGRYSEACPKLAESQRLDPGGGTLLNLGICHARVGLNATALGELRSALARAQADGRTDRMKTAQRHIDDLTPLLSWLRVRAASDTPPGLRIEIDGVELAHANLGAEFPIDPGVHVVQASAPGKKPWSKSVQIAPASDHQSVEIPPLEPESSPPVSAPSTAPRTAPPPVVRSEPAPFVRANREGGGELEASDSTRFIGYASGGIGLVALGVGAYFGARAITLKKRSDEVCDGESCWEQRGEDDWSDAKTAARISTVSVGVGLVGVGVGTYLLFFHSTPKAAEPPVHVSFRASPQGGVAEAGGRF
jgi:hypothetical protein